MSYNIYLIYQNSRIKKDELKRMIEKECKLTSNDIWNKQLTNDHKNEFLNILETIYNRINFYDNKINKFLGQKGNNSKKNSSNKSNFKNSNITDVLDIALFLFKEGGQQLSNENKKMLKNRWKEYWQIFGLVLLILDNEIELSFLKNTQKLYTYDIFDKILNNVLSNEKNWNKIKPLLDDQYNSFFDYLSKKYCGVTYKDLITNLPKSTGKNVHQLTKNIQDKIKKQCEIFEGSKIDPTCTNNMVCNFIIYNKSKKELESDRYQSVIKDMIEKMLVYYVTLAKIYSEIATNLRNTYNNAIKTRSITVSDNDYKKINRQLSKYMYLK
jgi:hypothetical protein